MINFNNKQTLITGGTGSFGNEFINQIIKNKVKPKKIVIYSRDEFKQSEMQKRYPIKKYPYLRFFLIDLIDIEYVLGSTSAKTGMAFQVKIAAAHAVIVILGNMISSPGSISNEPTQQTKPELQEFTAAEYLTLK